jgi:UDP-N-acetylmuramate: L-alanyl-gamma-D-glutamyl-meso-diaminopimelate ligase
MHQEAYARSFDAAARVVIAPRGRVKLDGDALDLDRLVQDLVAQGKEAVAPADFDAVVSDVLQHAKSGDVVALLSNGAFGGVPARVVEGLASRG